MLWVILIEVARLSPMNCGVTSPWIGEYSLTCLRVLRVPSSLDKDAYISMGGYPLEDHRQIHRWMVLWLVSFDLDETTVRRQLFNRPVASCRCLLRSSEEVVEGLEQVLRDGEADLGRRCNSLACTTPRRRSLGVKFGSSTHFLIR